MPKTQETKVIKTSLRVFLCFMPTYYCKTCDRYVYVSRPVNLVCHECGDYMARDDEEEEEEEYIMNLEEKWYSK